jgi:opacity protein-like surface antigen
MKIPLPSLVVATMATSAAFADPAVTLPNSTAVYVGAGIGASKLSGRLSTVLRDFHVDGHDTGWTLFVGVRPSKLFGAELSFTDFGSIHDNHPSGAYGPGLVTADLKSEAFGGYVVGYLPLSSPYWDVFGKIGAASLKLTEKTTGNYIGAGLCPINVPPMVCNPGTTVVSTDHRETDFAYGIGAQYHFGSLAARAEFQAIDTNQLLSLGLTWSF